MAIQKRNLKRTATIQRKTKETDIRLSLNVDGSGKSKIETGIPFLTHMLEQFSKHGYFDLEIKAKGDLNIDNHHLNEDLAICLGEAFKKALGDKKGIRRFGFFYVPMDDALVRVVLDISNRPFFILSGIDKKETKRDEYYFEDMEHFFRSLAQHFGLNLQVDVLRGDDKHHILEASFKCLAKAVDLATSLDNRSTDLPSTKGVL